MNHGLFNNVITRLPIAMAGIVHANGVNGRSLPIFMNFILPDPCEMPFLPLPRRI